MPIYIGTFILCACMWFRGMQFYVYFFIIENYVSHHGDYSFIVIFAFHFFSPNYFQQYKITNIKKTIHIFSFSFLFFIFIFFTVIYVTGKFYFCCIPTANLKNYCLSQAAQPYAKSRQDQAISTIRINPLVPIRGIIWFFTFQLTVSRFKERVKAQRCQVLLECVVNIMERFVKKYFN